MEREGLYRFCGADGKNIQRCYFKKDAFALMSALFHVSSFSGATEEVANFYLLNYRLAEKDEEGISAFYLTALLLQGLCLAWRHIGLYSPAAGNSVFDWIEIWNESAGAWELYWPEMSAFLGAVNKRRTFFDVFASFARNEGEFTRIAPQKPLHSKFLTEAGLLEEARAALADGAKMAKFIERLEIFPVIRDRGLSVAQTAAQERYAALCPEKKARLGGNPDLEYAVSFLADDALRERVYRKQIYIVWHRLFRTGG